VANQIISTFTGVSSAPRLLPASYISRRSNLGSTTTRTVKRLAGVSTTAARHAPAGFSSGVLFMLNREMRLEVLSPFCCRDGYELSIRLLVGSFHYFRYHTVFFSLTNLTPTHHLQTVDGLEENRTRESCCRGRTQSTGCASQYTKVS
jgi:hypothetical protein